jgi:hypothetical protein
VAQNNELAGFTTAWNGNSSAVGYGKFINKYIYKPIENGFIKDQLDKKNITDTGKRRARFHQWLTEHGRNQLIMRIGKVEGLLEASPNKRRFEENVKRLTQPTLFDYLDIDDFND